jgi:hypothetical protein
MKTLLVVLALLTPSPALTEPVRLDEGVHPSNPKPNPPEDER